MPKDNATGPASLREVTDRILEEEKVIRTGTGEEGRLRQKQRGRMTARERIRLLLDPNAPFLEVGLWAAHGMYGEWGGAPAAGVVAGIGPVESRPCMVVANDATVKAGAFFPQTAKKVLRAQRIAQDCRIPVLYLVDSAGVFLPLQDEIFPDQDDFGRVFRNNSVLSAAGIPQYAAIMGNCVAGGAYLPVLCDKSLMTEGSALYLAGPALVKAAIGETADAEALGGAGMHASISGTIDFHEKDDPACLRRLRSLVAQLPAERYVKLLAGDPNLRPGRDPEDLYGIVPPDGRHEYDVRDLLACVVDADSLLEAKAAYGRMVVTATAAIGGRTVGIVASQRTHARAGKGAMQIGGVLYPDSADKAARFVMECNQAGRPIVFFQDVQGFMVGTDAEQAGIIRSGAKLVNVVSNSVVPKITVIVGGSYGAGHYALCGKAFDPTFIFAWPNARYAVMGPAQAAGTLVQLEERQARRGDEKALSEEERAKLRERVEQSYATKTDIRYGAARGWVDALIAPDATRSTLIAALTAASGMKPSGPFRTGVLQT